MEKEEKGLKIRVMENRSALMVEREADVEQDTREKRECEGKLGGANIGL